MQGTFTHNIFDVSVLYVEDDENIRKSLTRVLRRIFKEVHIAQDGEEGLASFEQYHPDVVITDIKMPKKNGLDMAREIKKINPSTPIAVTTAHSESEFLLDAINSHIDHFLMKPIDYDKLLHTIEIIAEDIALKKQVRLEQQRFKSLLDFQPNIVLLTDGKQIIKANREFFSFFGYETLEAFYSEHRCFCEFFVNESGFLAQGCVDGWVQALLNAPDRSAKAKMKSRVTDEELTFVVRCGEIDVDNAMYVISFTDITQLQKQSQLLEKLSSTDALTGIMNRLKFNEIFEMEFAQAARYSSMPLSVIMLDIDHFKKINDTYGHDCGDIVLISLCREIEKRVRETDIFARWGGEEFMLLLPNTKKSDAVTVANSICKIVEEEVAKEVGKISPYEVKKVTCSLGVTQYAEKDDKKSLLRRADDALYAAKHAGRNRVETL